MQAFVTGGSGFLGGALIRALVARGDKVVALARSDGAVRRVAELGARPVAGDLADVEAMTRGMRGCELVFHCAALAKAWGPHAEFEAVNVAGTAHALAAALDAGVRRFVHVSTEAVLIDGRPLINADESWPLPAHPLARYPATKAAAERLVCAANSADFQTVVVRPRFIWGRGDTTILPQLVAAVKAGRFRWIDGGCHRTSTCHVANAVEGLLLAAERGRPGKAYFVTDGEPIEACKFLTQLLATQGIEAPRGNIPRGLALALATVFETLWERLPLRGTPPLMRFAVRVLGEEVTVNDARARKELGYVGRMTREQGLREMTAG